MHSLRPAHFIPVVNQVQRLLPAALEGCRAHWDDTVVIDNRHNATELQFDLHAWIRENAQGVSILDPSAPLTTAQTMNAMLKLAKNESMRMFSWQHLDAVPQGDTLSVLRYKAIELFRKEERWGVIFTHYDTCAAYNTAALLEIGGWDWLRFPFYFLDNDIHHRLRLAGYPTIETGLPVIHTPSQTINGDPERLELHESQFELSKIFFKKKWPGLLK